MELISEICDGIDLQSRALGSTTSWKCLPLFAAVRSAAVWALTVIAFLLVSSASLMLLRWRTRER